MGWQCYLKTIGALFISLSFICNAAPTGNGNCNTNVNSNTMSCSSNPISCSQMSSKTNPCSCSVSHVVTTVVDNTVSNALANALQLLIVSNLMETLMPYSPQPMPNAPMCDLPQQVCQQTIEYMTPVSEIVTYDPCDCGCGFIDSISEPFMYDSLPPCLAECQNCGPLMAEATFPSSIPAQLVCNFGYVPNNKACLSFNVEPVSFIESCGCPIC